MGEDKTNATYDRVPLFPAQSLNLQDICCGELKRTPLATPCPLMTPSPMMPYSQFDMLALGASNTEVRDMLVPLACTEKTFSDPWNATCQALGLFPYDTNQLSDEGVNDILQDVPTERARQFCTQDPLFFEGVDIGSGKACSGSPIPSMTPSPLFS